MYNINFTRRVRIIYILYISTYFICISQYTIFGRVKYNLFNVTYLYAFNTYSNIKSVMNNCFEREGENSEEKISVPTIECTKCTARNARGCYLFSRLWTRRRRRRCRGSGVSVRGCPSRGAPADRLLRRLQYAARREPVCRSFFPAINGRRAESRRRAHSISLSATHDAPPSRRLPEWREP